VDVRFELADPSQIAQSPAVSVQGHCGTLYNTLL
jgi:hypothetical protein